MKKFILGLLVLSPISAFATDSCVSLASEVIKFEQSKSVTCKWRGSIGITPTEKEYYICRNESSVYILRYLATSPYRDDCLNWTQKTRSCHSDSVIKRIPSPDPLITYIGIEAVYNLRVRKHWDYECQ